MAAALAAFVLHLTDHMVWFLTTIGFSLQPMYSAMPARYQDKIRSHRILGRSIIPKVIVYTIAASGVLIACFLGFRDEYDDAARLRAKIDGQGGYREQLARLTGSNGTLVDSINGKGGYRDQISSLQTRLGLLPPEKVIVESKEIPVVIPSGAVQMTPEQEEKIKKIRETLSEYLLTGQRLANAVTEENEASLEPVLSNWTNNCSAYLAQNLDKSYAARFLDGGNVNPGITRAGLGAHGQAFFQTVRARDARLVEILSLLSK